MKRLLPYWLTPLTGFLLFHFSTLAQLQEWESQNELNNVVWELFPDSSTDKLYMGGKFRYIDGFYTGNMTAFDGQQHLSLADSSSGINYCWNLGCQGVASIIRYKDDIIASLVRSSTYQAIPQIIGVGKWNGQKWHPLDGGVADYYNNFVLQWEPSTIYDFYLDNDTLYVAGYFTYTDSLPARGLASWDGTKWHIYDVPQPNPGAAVLATSVSKYKGNIYLGGNFIVNINGQEVNDLIRFDGTDWHGCGMIDGWTNIHDLEVFQGKLYVAGYFTQTDGPAAGNAGNSIMSWDGEKWDDLGGGVCSPYGAIDDLFVHGDKLFVAGAFDCIGGIDAHNVATWDGEKWCSIGRSVFNRAVHAIAVWHDTVYIGGSFFEIDSQPAFYFARYIGDHSTDTCSAPVVAATEPQQAVAANISVNPNPAHTAVILMFESAIHRDRPVRFSIFNSLGQQMWSVESVSGREEVSLVGWLPGVYVARAESEQGAAARVFVKQ
jgi:hypothetical protein